MYPLIYSTPKLIIDVNCIGPKYTRGIIVVPPCMEVSASTILSDVANGNIKRYGLLNRIINRYEMANGPFEQSA